MYAQIIAKDLPGKVKEQAKLSWGLSSISIDATNSCC